MNRTADQDIGEAVDDAVLRRFLGHHLRRASNFVQSDLARSLKDVDLRMITMSVLTVIVEHRGLRQSQLADALQIERPNLVSILDELEDRKLVERTRVPTDRRAYALTPTAAGEALAAKASQAVRAHEDRVFARLSASERSSLQDLLMKVYPGAEG
ncbi:MarR family transcriptional regulator [Roseivivax halodurans JCM 10272]|uniref:MarR family transcriptional regulator n=1 Tax=Roseivivax halodurans JCM 10272 TaxID=1449350 RepID=X7EIQ2_9RHOB|nr:MarR family transcriptional regulator [Roseivivax halodurans]ETX15765.1 MarR family transcriptional regulator [Roseivivax halodurans JCM 10272]